MRPAVHAAVSQSDRRLGAQGWDQTPPLVRRTAESQGLMRAHALIPLAFAFLRRFRMAIFASPLACRHFLEVHPRGPSARWRKAACAGLKGTQHFLRQSTNRTAPPAEIRTPPSS